MASQRGGAAGGCPICGKAMPRAAGGAPAVAPAPEAKADAKAAPDPFPFCSTRCQLVDLGRWLGDEYRIPDRETVVWPPLTDDGDGGGGDDRG